VPLLDMVSIAAKSARLENFATNPTNMTDFSGISRWYLDPPTGPATARAAKPPDQRAAKPPDQRAAERAAGGAP
jgi:hypothetical protein